MLRTTAECQRFIETNDPASIAARLRKDQELCRKGGLPTLLALSLPRGSSALIGDISKHLLPHNDVHVPIETRLLHYEGVIQGIKYYLENMDEHRMNSDQKTGPDPNTTVPTTEDFQATLRVLDYFSQNSSIFHITQPSTLREIATAVQTQLSLDHDLRDVYHSLSSENEPNAHQRKRKCYICHFRLTEPHYLYPSLCRPCGNFNLSHSNLSLPENLDLSGKTALVTGGRVNLGYHTALRLLRCGANVIVSSRYPRDAEFRYREEYDFPQWQSRLKIVGADFRTAKDAFQLVVSVKQILSEWQDTTKLVSKLDILINNAAQTLTDPVVAEINAITRENQLQKQLLTNSVLIHNGKDYEPKVRGGAQIPWVSNIEAQERLKIQEAPEPHITHSDRKITTKGLWTTEAGSQGKSSWKQSMHEIPYEDMVSAHSVNAFVPLILCRELLGSMAAEPKVLSGLNDTDKHVFSESTSRPNGPDPIQPLGYIINVSSREGIFETSTRSRSKAGHHVHTNMSKAAINMITETESRRVWTKYHIAMNTVDPGYMSAAPDCQPDDGCPIGFDDGAARVLWPVAVGIQNGSPIWGRFLKHFGELDPGTGRGTR